MSSAEKQGGFVMHVDGCQFEKSFSVKCQLLTLEVKLSICIFVLFFISTRTPKTASCHPSDKQPDYDILRVSLEVSSNFRLVSAVLSF